MDVEQEAAALGWVPKEQFRGDPEKWTDAETFVRRGHEIMPILRKNNEKLTATVENLTGEVSTLKESLKAAQEAMAEFKQYHEETAKREYQRAVEDLKAKRKQARADGEHELADEINDALDELSANAPKEITKPAAPAPAPTPAQPNLDPEYVKWEKDNEAWLKDSEKAAYAQSIAQYVRATSKLTGRAFLDKITEEVETRFSGSRPGRVEGTGGTPRAGGKTYSDLPAEARAACDRMAAKLVGPNRAFADIEAWRKSYVKSYDWN